MREQAGRQAIASAFDPPTKTHGSGHTVGKELAVGDVADLDTMQIHAKQFERGGLDVELVQRISRLRTDHAGVPLQGEAEGLLRGDDQRLLEEKLAVRGRHAVGQVVGVGGRAEAIHTTTSGELVSPKDLLFRVLVIDVDAGVIDQEVVQLFRRRRSRRAGGRNSASGLCGEELNANRIAGKLFEVGELARFGEGAEVEVAEAVGGVEELGFCTKHLRLPVEGCIIVDHVQGLARPKALDLIGGNESGGRIHRRDGDRLHHVIH